MHKFSISFSIIMDLNFGCHILKKKGESGKERMTSNCIAFFLSGEIKIRAVRNLLSNILAFSSYIRVSNKPYHQFIELNSSILLIYQTL